MPLRASYFRKVFRFNFKARTSRGVMKERISWFIRIHRNGVPGVSGLGECGPLPGLSADDKPDYEQTLRDVLDRINVSALNEPDLAAVKALVPDGYSSMTFGLETALLDLQNGGRRLIFKNKFVEGRPIPINGLIWMGDIDFMMDQINKKIAQGFRCLKLKVGGLDFERECDILSYIRRRYFRDNIIIRLDANGAFKTDDVLYKLGELASFDVHSIEQPIKPGLEEMEELCRKSPIPIAFDEELIGKISANDRLRLLKTLKPRFIVLKPSLHGGLTGCEEWIALAESLNIGWWLTSALESSIGLNAICQFAGNYDLRVYQGLGTGAIYENNVASPLIVKTGDILYDPKVPWEDIAQ